MLFLIYRKFHYESVYFFTLTLLLCDHVQLCMLCSLFETIVNQASPDYVIYVVGEKFYFFGKQEIAICINLQLPIVILKKSIILDMHHKTYMYTNFQKNRVSRSVKTVHTNLFAKICN